MNFGRFFKLNQNLSSMVNGITIFDYTELPAYEGLDANNPMSPKYPISLSITDNSVRFKMHYCVYRCSNIKRERQQKQLQQRIGVIKQLQEQEQLNTIQRQQEKRHEAYDREVKKLIPESIRRILGLRPIYKETDSEIIIYGGEKPKSYSEQLIDLEQQREEPGPYYGFNIDDIRSDLNKEVLNNSSDSDELNVGHVEEVILELPFSSFESNSLTKIIKNAYIATFPQIREGDNDDYEKTGSRFLDRLINQKLSGRRVYIDESSYSTLWMMDLYSNDGKLCIDNNRGLVNKFLRKLLLDFMFDLNHSDLFQVSPKYDQMYSGLMSNYYFSALMHKCEYYYYRDITFKAIKVYKENISKIKQLNEPTTEKNKLIKTEKDRIIHLYAKELFEAEEQWANDIRNPLSEDYFEPDFPDDFSRASKTQWGRWCTEICSMFGERMTSTCWNSWFSNSEEEMRRIYFPYKSYNFCNSVSLIERFHLFFDKSEVAQSMMLLAQKSRGKSSRWFLNRYDFNDVLHLHLFKHCNLLFILVILAFFVNLFFFKENLMMFSQIVFKYLPYLLLISSLFIAICQWLNIVDKHEKKRDIIYYRFVIKKFWVVAATFTFFLFLFMLLNRKFKLPYDYWSLSYILYWIIGLVSFIVLALATIIPLFKWPKLYAMNVTFHPIKSLHLFFPKVIASIITAWLTLSVPTFRNSICSLNTNIFIVIVFVVLFFFLYLIDQVCSAHNNLTKVLRAFEFLIISYGLSLAVGYIIIILGASNNEMNNLYKSSAMALFIGLFLRMIFRSQKQMTDI